MSIELIKVADSFWNIRGVFKIGGVINIGTHSSLVRRSNGKFVLLDAYPLSGEVQREVHKLTNGGSDIEAILHLHPFHTVHVLALYEAYPHAAHYGTKRHHERFPTVPWQAEKTESEACHALFAEDFEFSIPAGVDFISANENIHFSSVMAYHKASKTVHVDDTVMLINLPKVLGAVGKKDVLSFHMTLGKALEKRAGAAAEFRQWAQDLAERWSDSQNLCAAHSATLVGDRQSSWTPRLLNALRKVERTLKAHEKKYG